MSGKTTGLIENQIAYYRARASEYDEWWQRSNRYDHGAEAAGRWEAEVAEVERALDRAGLAGDILELACGTGWWTERLARRTGRLSCIDSSPEVIAINRARLDAASLPRPAYETADLFNWQPVETFDVIFFSFWLSHVPEELFESFWSNVAKALKPGGRVFFIDSARMNATPAAPTSHLGIQHRQLNDGRSFPIVKLFYKPAELCDRLFSLGWQCEVESTKNYFIHGLAQYRG